VGGPIADPLPVFEHSLEGREVSRHRIRVAREGVVSHSRLSTQREDNFATGSIGDDPHRVVDSLSRWQGDIVIQYAELVARHEGR